MDWSCFEITLHTVKRKRRCNAFWGRVHMELFRGGINMDTQTTRGRDPPLLLPWTLLWYGRSIVEHLSVTRLTSRLMIVWLINDNEQWLCPSRPPLRRKLKSVTGLKNTLTAVRVLPRSRLLHHRAVAAGTFTRRSCLETGASKELVGWGEQCHYLLS